MSRLASVASVPSAGGSNPWILEASDSHGPTPPISLDIFPEIYIIYIYIYIEM